MIVFSQEWFKKYQKQLLFFANTWIGRRILRIHGDRSDVGKNKVVKIEPNAIHWMSGEKYIGEYRTHAKYSKRLYHAFKPIWWTMHAWDMAFANNLNTALNLGFDTLTVYPDADPETTTVDGSAFRTVTAETWATIRSSTGTSSISSGASLTLYRFEDSATTNRWLGMSRSIILFNTSSIKQGSTIDSAYLAVYKNGSIEGGNTPTVAQSDMVVVSASPSSNTNIVAADYEIAKFGSTALADRFHYADYAPGYNTFTLNASGLAAITEEGITKLGIRSGADFDNSEPTWPSNRQPLAYSADYTGVARDPKLTITYTQPITAYYSASAPYASGKLMRDTGSGWTDVSSGDLRFITYTEEGDTTVPQLSVDPSTIVADALDYFIENGGDITYTGESLPLTGTTVSYTFVAQTILDVINKCLELAPSGWYWYIDPATNILYFKEKNTAADHKFTLGKDFTNLEPDKRADDIYNTVFFTGGDTGSGILYKKYTNAASIAIYGVRATTYVDERVTLAATAQLISASLLQAKSIPEIRLVGEVTDSNISEWGFDIEKINVGDVANIRNTKGSTGSSLWNSMRWNEDKWNYNLSQIGTMYLQIIRKEYSPTDCKIFCSTLAPDVNKRIEDIKRNLEKSQTVNNPDTPT